MELLNIWLRIYGSWKRISFFRQIQIYQRDQSCVYDSQVDQTSAAEVLQECLFGKWTKVEEEMLKLGQERLKEFNTETKK